MSIEDITAENSLNLWNLPFIVLMIFITSILGCFGFVALFAAIISEPAEIHNVLIIAFTIAYGVIITLRNHIIKKIFLVSPIKFLQFNYILKTILGIVIVIIYGVMFSFAFLPTEIYDISTLVLVTYSFVFLYFPFFLFGTAVSKSGEIRISFEALFSRINNFDQRQKWSKKVFELLEGILERGNVKVSSDKLLYHFNLKLMNSEDIQKDLRDIECWMLGKQTKKIVNSIKQIIPEDEIKPIEKTSLLDRFLQIPSDYIKYFFFTIIVVIVLIVKPEWVEKLITEFLK
ncbi:MAG: hypothetical protein ACFFDC_21130 [Promethearchaeota archaeon]